MIRDIQSKEFKELIEKFKVKIVVENFKSDLKGFVTPVQEFLIWLEKKGITSIKFIEKQPQILLDYYDYLSSRPTRRGGTLAESTINGHLYSLRLFQDDLLEHGAIESTILMPKNLKGSYMGRIPFTTEEIKQLYDACESKFEINLLNLAYGCGLRANEIRCLNVTDIKFQYGTLIVQLGKGDKRREIPLSDKLIGELQDFIRTERNELLRNYDVCEESYLVGYRGQRPSKSYIYKTFKKIVERSHVNRDGSLHDMRASIAHHLLDNGAEIEFVKNFLGHESIDTTHIYAMKRKWNRGNNILTN